jgi:DNA-binding phage protein
MMHYGMIVQGIRETLHWSVAHLEEKSGISRQAIYRMEKTGGGRIETYEAVLGAMGYELDITKKDGWGIE